MTNFDTVREALELATPHYQADTARFAAAITALAQIEADHFSAADMADAQAKAFRAGVASVTAGQEPVAWVECDGELVWNNREAAIGRNLYTAAPVAQQPPKLEDIEQYRMQMAGICTAATGYWKESDSIHPNYDTPALREVAKLYAKYAALYKAQQPQAEAVLGMYEHKCPSVTGHRGPSFVCQKAGHAVGQHSYCNECPTAPQQADAVPTGYVIDRGFRWDGENQQHIPQLTIEFEPVHANGPCDAQGWKDRDAVARMFAAQGAKT